MLYRGLSQGGGDLEEPTVKVGGGGMMEQLILYRGLWRGGGDLEEPTVKVGGGGMMEQLDWEES